MREKFFMTFVTKEHFLERNIKSWLDSNKYKEVDRSAPALTVDKGDILVAVTVTAEKIM